MENFKGQAKNDPKEGGFAVLISIGLAHLQSHNRGSLAVSACASSTSHADITGRHHRITSLGRLLEVDVSSGSAYVLPFFELSVAAFMAVSKSNAMQDNFSLAWQPISRSAAVVKE